MNRSLLGIVARIGPARAWHVMRLALKEELVDRDAWFDSSDVSEDHGVFVGGCGRSGTTLLREMLARSSELAGGPETALLCDVPNPSRLAAEWGLESRELERLLRDSPSAVRFAEAFYRRAAEREGKPRWVDKTPRHVRAVPRILSAFPNARFVHMLRDGRDVACSLQNHPRQTVRNGKVVPNESFKPVGWCARRWRRDAGAGLAVKDHPRVLTVRYEDLTSDTERVLREVCAFIGVAYASEMAEGGAADPAHAGRLLNNERAGESAHRGSVGRWARDMTMGERRDFHRVAGALLVSAGYAPDDAWLDAPIERAEESG